jgi:hypothetical protein
MASVIQRGVGWFRHLGGDDLDALDDYGGFMVVLGFGGCCTGQIKENATMRRRCVGADTNSSLHRHATATGVHTNRAARRRPPTRRFKSYKIET